MICNLENFTSLHIWNLHSHSWKPIKSFIIDNCINDIDILKAVFWIFLLIVHIIWIKYFILHQFIVSWVLRSFQADSDRIIDKLNLNLMHLVASQMLRRFIRLIYFAILLMNQNAKFCFRPKFWYVRVNRHGWIISVKWRYLQ